MEDEMNTLEGEICPMCQKNTLTLMEARREVPYFGILYVFSMNCTNCKFHKGDVEAEEKHDPVSVTIKIDDEEDMKIRVIKSSEATIKIPRLMTIEPGEDSIGYVSNVEGVLNRVKEVLEFERDNAEDNAERKKLRRRVKKIQDTIWGRDSLTLKIEDPSGNSMIISDKAEVKKL